MSYFNFTPYGPGLTPTDISQVSNDNFLRLQRSITDITDSGGWIGNALPNVSTVTYNGNRSYDLTFTGDISKTLSPGMRLRTERTVSAPTQCTNLNGTTQYWSKSSPSGMASAFTAYTLMAWVKLNTYSGTHTIISRNDTTAGFAMHLVTNTGQVRIFFGTSSNFTDCVSYASIPINKWVHLTSVCTSTASKTFKIYIDGIEVASYVGGTATSMTHSGNLQIGASNSGNVFNGKIAQAAVFNAALSQSTILSYISQGLSGSETNLVSAFSFNGNANDLNTTNANNLTAQGSATATNADSPFSVNGSGTATGTDDYALVQKVSSTVATVQVPSGCTIPTTGGISATYVSTVKNPFNWVSDAEKWTLLAINIYYLFTPTNNTWYNLASMYLDVPAGSWNLGYQMADLRGAALASTSTWVEAKTVLSTTSASAGSSIEQIKWTAQTQIDTYVASSVAITCNGPVSKDDFISISSITRYYLNYWMQTGGSVFSSSTQNGGKGPFFIRALPSGL